MTIEVRPATRFADVATMLGPKKSPDSSVCWCLSHRVDAKTNRSLAGRERADYVRKLCRHTVPPGVLAYDGDDVAGWAGIAPRAELPVARSTKIKAVDDLPVWSIFCVRVRSGFRGRGIAHELVAGAVDLARSQGAPAVEAIPVDNRGQKVDLTMAFVGTRSLFEQAGFTKVADTESVTDGFPRVVMRLPLE
ncbi:GNAT family N-acetyltransferase [Microlunatus speluncae]|uniref:GNAT family N-acetyltransferase n=1 Tax=Microlunatus speluncae TaxID=2594267 RepID=UPI0012661C1D|nr:GNAT family N-acetyltransferase [Microlunatus speluncae]